MRDDLRVKWTPEREETLKRLYAEKLSYSLIAAELGGITRNAVIGKSHRMGLERRGPADGQPVRKTKFRKPYTRAPWAVPRPHLEATEALELPVEIVADPVTLRDLESHHCRWPLGDPPDMMFCGAHQRKGYSYCARHYRMAYQPSREITRAEHESQQRKMAKMRKARAA